MLRAPVAQHGVTPTRLTALATLEKHGPMRPGELADRMSISAASMSRLTEVLLALGAQALVVEGLFQTIW